MRRLTQQEYANSVGDLFGWSRDETRPLAVGLPDDGRAGPFQANHSTVATLEHVKGYAIEAEEIARRAVAGGSLPCDPANVGEDACADQIIRELGRRAYRRPLSVGEETELQELYDLAGDFAAGTEMVIQVLLQSPHFLYLVEGDAATDGPSGSLDGYSIASRLSYFVWKSIPDDDLLDAAERGELDDVEGVKSQARRMLADPRGQDMIREFHFRWLGISGTETAGGIAEVFKAPQFYPDFDDTLRSGLEEESSRFIAHLFAPDFGGNRLHDLFLADYTFVDDRVAEHYGVADRPGEFERVALGPDRRGILTHGSLLASHATPSQSDPIKRGLLVRERLFCQHVEDPPPELSSQVAEIAADPDVPRRLQYQMHAENPCASCHRLIDPIGFGFEHFDGTGAYRAEDGGQPVDATGELTATKDSDGAFDGAVELARQVAASAEVRECTVRQWFRYALGRLPSQQDACAIRELSEGLVTSNGDLRQMLVDLAAHDVFRRRRVPE